MTMNLLYITKTSPLSPGGGGEKRAREVTAGLASRGYDVTILCGKTDRDLEKSSEFKRCDVRHVSCVPSILFRYPTLSFYATRYLFAITSLPVLVGLLIRDEFDVIMENMTPYPSLSVGPANMANIPIVAVQHEFYDRSCYRTYDPMTATIQLAVQNILRLCRYSAVIVPTSHVKQQLSSYGVKSARISVIPNGIDSEQYQLSDIEDEDNSKLVTVGRLSKRKAHSDVLRAFAQVQVDHPEATLEMIGDGPARERLERLAKSLSIEEKVTFHGFMSEEDKIEILNLADVFVFASKQEGFGLVLLEAMAAGLPVVARHLPVYEDFFSTPKNGYLVHEPVISNLTNSITELLENTDEREAIGCRNRNNAAGFDWERTVRETASVLNSIERTVAPTGEESEVRS
jgi:glycosyltransferase involved in cell wall biosynthesis